MGTESCSNVNLRGVGRTCV